MRIESTHWRDQELSERHRTWGWNCPAVDIDFLMVDYDNGEAVALIEYKRGEEKAIDLNHPSYLALRGLASSTGISFFIVFYRDTWRFRMKAGNPLAEALLRDYKLDNKRELSELEYVTFLYSLRGRKLPDDVLRNLSTEVA